MQAQADCIFMMNQTFLRYNQRTNLYATRDWAQNFVQCYIPIVYFPFPILHFLFSFPIVPQKRATSA